MCGVWRAQSISSNSNAPRGNIGSIKLEFKSYPFKTNTMGTGLLKGCLQITSLSDDALFIVTQTHKGRVGFNFKVPFSIDSSERKNRKAKGAVLGTRLKRQRNQTQAKPIFVYLCENKRQYESAETTTKHCSRWTLQTTHKSAIR